MKEPKSKRWMGTKPVNCQICGEILSLYFVDFKTRSGLWAIGCVPCFEKESGRLGVGLGQKFRLGDLTRVSAR